MGSKESNFFQSNRPESGGTRHDEKVEQSGILEREKAKVDASQGSHPPVEPPHVREERSKQRGPAPEELEREERSDDSDPGHS